MERQKKRKVSRKMTEKKSIANIFKNNSKLYLGKDFNEEKLKSLELTFPYSVGFNKFVGITESIILSKYPIKKNYNSNNDAILTKIIVNGVELNI